MVLSVRRTEALTSRLLRRMRSPIRAPSFFLNEELLAQSWVKMSAALESKSLFSTERFRVNLMALKKARSPCSRST